MIENTEESAASTAQRNRGKFSYYFRKHFTLIVLFALIIFFKIASPYFFTFQNFANIGRQTSIVSIIAVGMTLVIITGQIDLSVGSLFVLTGIASALVMQNFGNSWILGALAAICVGAICGFINGIITVKLKVPSFMVTLGMLGVFRGVAMLVTETRPVLIANNTYFKVFGETRFFGLPIAVIWTIAIVWIGAFLLHRTAFGLRIFATGGNPQAARYTGVKTGQTIIYSFMILGALTGLGALLFTGIAHAARPDLGVGLELDVIAAVILGGVHLFGGRGTVVGAIIGSLIIGVINNGLVLVGVTPSIQLIIKGIVIILAVSLSRK